jgi:hypothetical protein
VWEGLTAEAVIAEQEARASKAEPEKAQA